VGRPRGKKKKAKYDYGKDPFGRNLAFRKAGKRKFNRRPERTEKKKGFTGNPHKTCGPAFCEGPRGPNHKKERLEPLKERRGGGFRKEKWLRTCKRAPGRRHPWSNSNGVIRMEGGQEFKKAKKKRLSKLREAQGVIAQLKTIKGVTRH